MKKGLLLILFVFIININLIFAEEINLIYPSQVEVGEEFTLNLELINFSDNIYDVKIEILNGTKNIAQIFWDDEWKSSFYWIRSIIDSSEEDNKDIRLKIIESYEGELDISLKINGSDFYQEFEGYKINIISNQDNVDDNEENEENQESEEDEKILLEMDWDEDEIINGEEFEIKIKAFNLKKKDYDVKVFIYEDDKNQPISEIYNEEDEWISGKNYFKEFFEGPGDKTKEVNLRIKETYRDLNEEVNIRVRIRETDSSSYEEEIWDYIDILEQEDEEEIEEKDNEDLVRERVLNEIENKENPITGDVISLGNKKSEDIKTPKNIIYQSKSELIKKYSVYFFTLLCVILCILFSFNKF